MTNQVGNVTLIINMGGANNSQGGSGAEVQSLTLPITPEDIQINRPSRQAVTQTLTGAYQDHLGSGITTVTMRGHTGWRNLTPEGDGFNVIKKLRDLLGQYDKIVATDRPDRVSLMLLLNLPSGWEHFRVSKNTVSYTRSRAQPLLYRYEIQFIVLKDFNDATGQVDPSPNFVIQSGIFPAVQLIDVPALPDSATDKGTPGTGGSAADIVNDGTRDARMEPPATGTPAGTTWDTTPITLLEFTDRQFPPVAGWPGGMVWYIIAANPRYFSSGVDPFTYKLSPFDTLLVPDVDKMDIYHRFGSFVTSNDVYNLGGTIFVGGQITSLTLTAATYFSPVSKVYVGWNAGDPPSD